jgi:hypothetical protein
MPYESKKTAACPIRKPYGVFQSDTMQLMGCHASEADAGNQIQALYASEEIERAKYDGIDFTPPQGVQEEAAKGLQWRREHNRGGTAVGVARARDLSNGKAISPDTIGRIVRYFARHEVDKRGQGWSPGEKGFPSNGRIAWALWGGDPGRAWANKIQASMQSRDKAERMNKTEKIQRAFGQIKDGKAVIATETPIDIYDEQRGWIKQVLLMNGVSFRNAKKQLPIVDSHNDKTVRNVFGSIRNIEIQGGELVGVPEFASDADSQTVATRYNEGHLNDFSIDAQILKRQYVPEGQSYTTSSGIVVDGPAEIVTQWEPHNASICATGADPNSTVRRSSDRERKPTMDDALMATVRQLGVPEGVTDPSEIIEALADMMAKRMEDKPKEDEAVRMEGEDKPKEDEAQRAEHEGEEMKVEKMAEEVKAEVSRQLQVSKARRDTILNHCKLAKLERSFADSLIDDESISVQDAQERIIRKMAQQPLGAVQGSDFRITEAEQDKFVAAAGAGLVQRCFQGNVKRTQAPQVAGSEEFANLGLYRLAEVCLRRQGINPDKYTRSDVARMALGDPKAFDRLRVRRSADAYHTSGSFQNILFDAANKTLRAAYEEAPYTWSLWARQAQSVSDFKDIHRAQLGESPNLEMIAELQPYPEGPVTDSKVKYKVEKYGKKFSVSWETVVNDDLDALSRVPAMHGNAARRTQEKIVYDALLSNPTMPDGYSLFSASHTSGSNITAVSVAAPSVTTLNEAFELMGKQKGLNSDVILNLMPSVLLVPLKYSGTALELVNSQSYAQSNGNSGVVNIYGVNGVRPLSVVTTALLDANSSTNWYAIADNSTIDTAEITFLQGEESPVLESEWVKEIDAYEYYVRQTMAARIIDHRGIFGNRT